MNPLDFSNILLNWYSKNKRNLPWRVNINPFHVWLSEIIMQQTRINQGLAYFLKFTDRFKNVAEIATTNEDEILKLWQGLGYYSRARNLQTAAKQVMEFHEGNFPTSYEALIQLKGIGEYTASAISSLCANEPHAVVDGNVYRVLSRIFNIAEPIDTTSGKKTFKELASIYLSKEHPGEYNQAIMDFGALQCTPSNPDCTTCPFTEICIAKNEQLIQLRPLKAKKTKKRNRYLYYIVSSIENSTFIQQRSGNDIWKNLYEFPLIETETQMSITDLLATEDWQQLFEATSYSIEHVHESVKHLLSHQTLFITFIEISLTSSNNFTNHFKKIDKKNIFDLPVSKVVENFIFKKWK